MFLNIAEEFCITLTLPALESGLIWVRAPTSILHPESMNGMQHRSCFASKFWRNFPLTDLAYFPVFINKYLVSQVPAALFLPF
jgi:hypothetical protein